ncbi:peptidoglycan DD-metalloendopeptidase family protein [Sulfurospirillum halorespirans]|uniref:Putative metalloprotease n=1 Tax=Sulfurospirillum halorespirans DSM 13726 TaxID=1193502 RepID=A0A1D7TL79_9BACT|nr:peptidoglycan DD-metalloendopeptidase family protein [Sulfurospirillum halorespirans]AOO65742.1 putative metalloprotease [Sulfurospirillum halorespirans DSM 13726]
MAKFIIFLSLFVSFAAASYVEELKWPKGETFLTFLEKNHLPSSIYYTLDKEEQELAAEIVAGVKYQVLKSENNALEQVLIPIGEELQMHIKTIDDKFIMEITPILLQEEKRSLAIEIQNSPYVDILNATSSYGLANEFAQTFRGEVNLRNLQKGDKLVLLYQQKRRLGKLFGSIKIDVSMVETAKKKNYIFFYKENYYDPKGQELDSFLLSNPVNYTRVSSVFTQKRWHPILQKYRAHLGIDYAASVGTPVKSAGSGRVLFVGQKGGYGNTIEVSHDSSYKTLYAHLNGFAKGIRSGQKVKQGQVIAYVGNTGLSSGPHLHFGLYRSNVAINPASVVKIAKSALGGNELKAFINYTDALRKKVESAQESNEPVYKEENFNLSYPFEQKQS